MSIRGMKKAFVRAPHVLIGNKSPEDLSILEWTRAINEAEDGLHEIIVSGKKFRDAWIAILDTQVGLVAGFEELYKPIAQLSENGKAPRETPASTMAAVDKYHDVLVEIKKAVQPIMEGMDRQIIGRCETMKGFIETIKKAMKKRERKKIDYDRHLNTVEKLTRKGELSDKDTLAMMKGTREFDKAKEEFTAHDDYIKDLLPKVIDQLSEFIAPLAAMLFTIQMNVITIYHDFIYPYAQAQGLMTQMAMVTSEWAADFIPVQHKVEDSLKIVREGKAVKKPMALPIEKPMDEKIKKAFSINKKARPSGTAKDGSYRTFSGINRAATMSSVAGSDAGSDVGSEISSPTLGSSPDGFKSSFMSRTMSMSSTTSSSRMSEPLPRYHPTGENFSSGLSSMPEEAAAVAAVATANGSSSLVTPVTSTAAVTAEAASAEEKSPIQYELMTAQYTFVGTQDTDLSFSVGDQVKVYKKNEDDWWEGETMDGKKGEFPGNYVK
ncbi:uncharacterized protein V1518DRAFT_385433 [Limtongia smithiae]|uniref:uncharacterized protein n=1 Tax=Limtongia smithiae TaxID=1125753 RepID=UPI0034CDC29E